MSSLLGVVNAIIASCACKTLRIFPAPKRRRKTFPTTVLEEDEEVNQFERLARRCAAI